MVEADGSNSGREVAAEWFDLHAAAVGRYAARRVGSHLARDIVAETFRIAYEQSDRFDAQRGEPRAWLYGIATNLVRRHRRTEERRMRIQARSLHLIAPATDPLVDLVDDLDARNRYDMVVDAVARLDPDDRDLLVLIAWEEMSSREAAAVLGIPAGTVRSRLNRIRIQLNQMVHEGEPDG